MSRIFGPKPTPTRRWTKNLSVTPSDAVASITTEGQRVDGAIRDPIHEPWRRQFTFQTPTHKPGAKGVLKVEALGYVSQSVEVPSIGPGDNPELPGVHLVRKQAPARTGLVRLEGHSFVDDQGAWLAVGKTFFPPLWMFLHDLQRLKDNLAWLTKFGVVDYVRCIGAVSVGDISDQCDPQSNPWACRSVPIGEVATTDLIADVTDLHYDVYGLRTEWTVFGGSVSSPGVREEIVRRFVQQLAPRAHKVQHVEVCNEAWNTFHDSPDPVGEIRHLGTILRDGLPNLVSLTAATEQPGPWDVEAMTDGYPLALFHLDRNQGGTGGRWRPMRQGWDIHLITGKPWVGHEGIGQNSSVAHEEDPLRLAMYAALNWLYGAAAHVHHTGSGVYLLDQTHHVGGFRPQNLWDVENLDATLKAIGVLRSLLPADLPNFEKHNTNNNFPNYPFDVNPLGSAVVRYEQSGASEGMLRAHAATSGDRMVVLPIHVRSAIPFTARRAMTFDTFDPMTGVKRETVTLDTGQTWTLEPTDAVVVVGRFL